MTAVKKTKPNHFAAATPVPPLDVLLNTISETFAVRVLKSDLTCPEKLLTIYGYILEDYGVMEGFQQSAVKFVLDPNMRGIDEMEQVVTYSNVWSILKSLDIFDFEITFGDIIAPTPKKVHAILGYLMNFWTYCSSRVQETDMVMETCKRIADQKNRLQHEAPAIERQINDAVAEIFNRRSQIDLKSEMIEDLSKKCKNSLDKKIQLQAEIKLLKAEQEKTDREHTDRKAKLEEFEHKIKDCESKILESPEKLDQLIEELKEELIRIKSEISQAAKKSENSRKAITNNSNWMNEISTVKSAMKSILEQRNNILTITDKIKKMELEKQSLVEEITEADSKMETAAQKYAMIKENIFKKEHQHQLKNASQQASVIEAKKSLEKLTLSKMERESDTTANSEEMKTLKSNISNLKLKWQDLEDNTERNVTLLNETLETYYQGAVSQVKLLNLHTNEIAKFNGRGEI